MFLAESVFMYEQPPPYPGMGPVQPNPPPPSGLYPQIGQQQTHPFNPHQGPSPSAPPYPGGPNMAPYPAAPPSYDQATALPQKVHMD